MLNEWSEWLTTCRRPVVFAFGGDWRTSSPLTLEAIRAELRELGVSVVVAARNAAFSLEPDGPGLPPPELDGRGFEALYRAIRVDPGDRYAKKLTLTLLDERHQARMQSAWPGGDEPAAVLADLFAWASRSLLETTTLAQASETRVALRFTRSEIVVLSLIGALAAPLAAGCQVHEPSPTRPSDRAPPVAFALPHAADLDPAAGPPSLKGDPRVSLLHPARGLLKHTPPRRTFRAR